jgi:hypothetical protein
MNLIPRQPVGIDPTGSRVVAWDLSPDRLHFDGLSKEARELLPGVAGARPASKAGLDESDPCTRGDRSERDRDLGRLAAIK